jgi:sporulation protein YlmC with PRC-barrel domain
MRKRIVTTMAVCAAGLVLSAFGQNPSTTPGGTTTDQSTSPSTSPAGSSTYDNTRRPGRMGQQEVRASKLMNSEVRSSQGQTLGTINDIVLNPSSGRIDFAVISLNSSASAISSKTPSTTPSTPSTTSTDTSSGGKLVAVPWMLLRPSTLPSSSVGGVSSSTLGQSTFAFAGDTSKLMSAPSFDQSNWPDITQYSWRQSIYSHFGMPGSATGGATSPGGYDSSTGSSTSRIPGSSSSTSPSPSPTSPDGK